MYLGVDIGGTKTLIALLSDEAQIVESRRFPTDQTYETFIEHLTANLSQLNLADVSAACVGVPGLLNREAGIVRALGNLPWRDKPIRDDITRALDKEIPVLIENDARLAGLSEAQLVKHHRDVLYMTVSTGIGGGFIRDGRIVRVLEDMEMGKMPLLHEGQYVPWENFASGRAIVQQYHQKAFEITDAEIWREIAAHISQGLGAVCSILQPDIVVVGGSVGVQADKFDALLMDFLCKHLHADVKPPEAIVAAQRPEEAVIFGCYDLAKQTFGHAATHS